MLKFGCWCFFFISDFIKKFETITKQLNKAAQGKATKDKLEQDDRSQKLVKPGNCLTGK